jgi:hypothetical protein
MLDELHLRNLSKCTERAYLTAVDQFARYFHVSPEKLGSEQVPEYLLHLIRDNRANAPAECHLQPQTLDDHCDSVCDALALQ